MLPAVTTSLNRWTLFQTTFLGMSASKPLSAVLSVKRRKAFTQKRHYSATNNRASLPSTRLTKSKPKNYMLVGFPVFQLLDAAGPLDILGTIAKTEEAKDINLTITGETPDSVMTAAKPPPGAQWKFEEIAEIPQDSSGRGMVARVNVSYGVDITFDDCIKALEQRSIEPPDVLIIPGGLGTRMHRIYNNGARESNIRASKDFVSKVVPYVKQVIMTVCTGSDLLSQTGLLDRRRATTNMRAFNKVAERNENVKWLKARRWVRSLPTEAEPASPAKDLEIWTSAGISAGIDLMLQLVAQVYGVNFARETANRLEYEWKEIPEGVVDSMYGLSEGEAN